MEQDGPLTRPPSSKTSYMREGFRRLLERYGRDGWARSFSRRVPSSAKGFVRLIQRSAGGQGIPEATSTRFFNYLRMPAIVITEIGAS